MTSKLLPLLTWRSAISDRDCTLEATTRHVGLALSLHMNEKGGSAFPGAELLAAETGLSERTVRDHLGRLVAAGWLVLVEKGGIKGGVRRANSYQATIPLGITTPAAAAPMQETAQMGAANRADPCSSRTPTLQEHYIELANQEEEVVEISGVLPDWMTKPDRATGSH